jgi:hypothetical protein
MPLKRLRRGREVTRWGAYVAQRIDDLRHGKGREDWEGQWPGPAAVTAAWDLACEIFRESTPAPSVVPGDDGAVLFIWHKNGVDAELEVSGTGADLWVHDRVAEDEWSGPVADCRDDRIPWLLDRLERGAS